MKNCIAFIAIITVVILPLANLAWGEEFPRGPLVRLVVQEDEVPDPPGFVPSEQPPQSLPEDLTALQDRQFDPALAADDSALRMAASQRRLARTPEMFGDFLGPQLCLPIDDPTLKQTAVAPGGGITKISDANKAAIGCRTYLIYNHFHNAIEAALEVGPGFDELKRSSIDRFVFGLERPLGASPWSAEFRVPIFVDLGPSFPGVSTYDAGNMGNIAGILKRELYSTDVAVLSAGLGVSLPTGDDIDAAGDDEFLLIRNEAVHLLPFVGVQRLWDRWFLHGFAQLDIDVNGNTVEGERTFFDSDVLTDQTLLFLDLSVGRWFYQNDYSPYVRGLAGLFEIHYETALEDADIVVLDIGPFPGPATIGNMINRFDVVHVTAALQADLGQRASLRVGASAPVTSGDNRFFDAEVAVQLIIRCHHQ